MVAVTKQDSDKTILKQIFSETNPEINFVEWLKPQMNQYKLIPIEFDSERLQPKQENGFWKLTPI